MCTLGTKIEMSSGCRKKTAITNVIIRDNYGAKSVSTKLRYCDYIWCWQFLSSYFISETCMHRERLVSIYSASWQHACSLSGGYDAAAVFNLSLLFWKYRFPLFLWNLKFSRLLFFLIISFTKRFLPSFPHTYTYTHPKQV